MVFTSIPFRRPRAPMSVSGFLYKSLTYPPLNGTVTSMSWRHHREQNSSNCRSAAGTFHIRCVSVNRWGRYPVKAIVGERFDVWPDVYRDGHEVSVAA